MFRYVVLSLTIVGVLAWSSTDRGLPSLTEAEMASQVGDPCGATTNLEWSMCGFDPQVCTANKVTIGLPDLKIPGTNITIPVEAAGYEWETTCSVANGWTLCQKKQHEHAVSAPGNRENDQFPLCGGNYTTYNCRDKMIVIGTAPGWKFVYPCIKDGLPALCEKIISNPQPIQIPHGCEETPNSHQNHVCPLSYQTMKAC